MATQPVPSGSSAGMNAAEEATARTLILAVLYRYASLAREKADHAQIAELFTSDGLVVFPDGRELAPSQLEEVTRSNPPVWLRHHLTTVDIQFVAPDEAHCQSYIIAGTNVKMPDHWGRWDDVVTRQADGRWLLKRKVVSVDGVDPNGWLAATIAAA